MTYELTWITEQLAVGHAPMSYEDLDFIKNQGVGAIVNLCGEFSDLHEIEEQAGFEVYYLPVLDECAPEMGAMEKALHWFDEAIYLNKKILVHCRHGMGRTGTFVSAYLLRRGLGLKLAEKALKATKANPTNYSQWKLLRKYGKQQGLLAARKASIEDTNTVDLSPFFLEYRAIMQEAAAGPETGQEEEQELDVERCCHEYFDLQLVEAVFVSHSMNLLLISTARQQAIHTALRLGQELHISRDSCGQHGLASCQSLWQSKAPSCPLLHQGRCQIFKDRPLHCRSMKNNADSERFEVMIANLSRDVFMALTGSFSQGDRLSFSMLDTISGRFVQQYFQAMLKKIR